MKKLNFRVSVNWTIRRHLLWLVWKTATLILIADVHFPYTNQHADLTWLKDLGNDFITNKNE